MSRRQSRCRRERVAKHAVARRLTGRHDARMNLAWVALIFGAVCISVLGAGCDHSYPPPFCSPPNGDGGRCSCPGTMAIAFGCDEVFTCRADGTWAPYDGSCLTPPREGGSVPDDAGAADATGTTNGEPCNDGTGLNDCCPASAQSGASCDGTVAQCWPQCVFASADGGQGSRSQMVCSGGTWSSGHGLFACQRGDGGQ